MVRVRRSRNLHKKVGESSHLISFNSKTFLGQLFCNFSTNIKLESNSVFLDITATEIFHEICKGFSEA
jgi:hypothetical protein